MTLYTVRPDPATGSLDDAEVVDQLKDGWEFLEQAITVWRLVDESRADKIEAIKDRASLAAGDGEIRFYAADLQELIRLLSGVDDAIIAAGIVDSHWRVPAERLAAEAERKQWEELAHAFERDLNAATAEQAKLVAAVATEAAKAPANAEKAVVARATAATKATELDERSTRIIIDGQLRDAGWEVDSEALTWKAGARPEKGKNRAIAEVPMETAEDGPGIADYVLCIGTTPYAVVEAKRKAKKIPSVLEQSKRYARGLVLSSNAATRAGEGAAPGWASGFQDKAPRYHVPFLYATNGRPYLRQLETESGVWFQDVRSPTNHPRPLLGWHTPEVLAAMLAHDPAASDQKLRDKPPDVIQQALGLRDYQIRAIHAVEQTIAAGQRSLLVAMATGTGKTRTVIGLIHRLLESQRFRRVLFLVDRSALGLQAQGAFNEVRLENLQTFAQNYDIKGLEDTAPAKETKVHIATVQGMVQRVLNAPSDEPPIPIDRYDCIIVDESHRGYTLDRDMTEGEQELRSFEDYVSTYRRVLDHFDAVKIGLTATPAQHTREIFGKPVFVYSYPEAVADGFLVDHEPPLQITTQLAKYGIKFERGAEVETLLGDGEIQLSLLPDEMNFEVASFNRTVSGHHGPRHFSTVSRNLRCTPIPIPSPPEQARVVDAITSALAIIASIARLQDSAIARVSRIERATLAKAFRGELVPQDPYDEPAAILLERICAARAAEPATPRRSRAAGAKEPAPTAAEFTNGHATTPREDPLDLVIAAFQQGEPRLAATAITQATGLDAAAVKRALATLVDSGQVRVHGRARGTTYEWAT